MSGPKVMFAGSVACVVLLSACGSGSAVVVPYDDGHFESTAQAGSRPEALRIAIERAKQECQSRHLGLAVSRSRADYTGYGDEEARRAIVAVGDVVASAGGDVPVIDTDEDYTATVEFQCQ